MLEVYVGLVDHLKARSTAHGQQQKRKQDNHGGPFPSVGRQRGLRKLNANSTRMCAGEAGAAALWSFAPRASLELCRSEAFWTLPSGPPGGRCPTAPAPQTARARWTNP
jgi:hypothetical protein